MAELTPAVQSANILTKRISAMAEKLPLSEVASFKEILLSNVVEQEALINLLEAKGIIKKSELLEEIRRLRNRQNKGRVR